MTTAAAPRPSSRIVAALALGVALAPTFAPSAAAADEVAPTFFVVELRSGVAQSAYDGGDPGLTYGFATGLTVRAGSSPLRFYLLGNLSARQGSFGGSLGGKPFDASRQDVDAFGSVRLVLPLVDRLRGYAEGGLGWRWSRASLARDGAPGLFDTTSAEPVAVVALGLQYRLTSSLSLGLRGEVAPTLGGRDVLADLTRVDFDLARVSATATLGFHF
jgi:hypothetical protein